MRAAAQAGHVDQAQYRVRLDPAVAAAQERWETLASMSADLTAAADRRVDPALAFASLEARAALRELLHDAAVATSVAVIAQRTDLSRTPVLVQQVLAANLDLAHVASEAAKDPQLTGAARGVNTMAIATRCRDPRFAHTIDDSPVDAVVAPRDLLANRAVPLPHHVRAELLGAAGSLVNAAGTAMSAGAQLESTTPKARHYGAPEPIHGRATQDRTPVRMPSRGPAGPGCER